MRVECQKIKETEVTQWRCVRAVEVVISENPAPKDDDGVDSVLLEAKISDLREQLSELQSKKAKTQELSELQYKLEYYDKHGTIPTSSGPKGWTFSFGLTGGGKSLKSYGNLKPGSELGCCFGFELGIERELLSTFSFGIGYKYLGGSSEVERSLSGPSNEGTPNTSQDFVTSDSRHEVFLFLPVRLSSNWFVSPLYGVSASTLGVTTRNYSSLGSGTWGSQRDISLKQRFFGVMLGYDGRIGGEWIWRAHLDYKRYNGSSGYEGASGVQGTLGVGVGF
jgi:hypothetical protein